MIPKSHFAYVLHCIACGANNVAPVCSFSSHTSVHISLFSGSHDLEAYFDACLGAFLNPSCSYQ